ncbi:hypothetical protein HYC85_020811 [Camellia sinensis]|uniref:Uncharacterized protein n=1 Tax=Camellia sinensis TaxID=4442 RepID=A0A7J7GQW3_CAMSI|nr:hypothetical protein HYC85_020811 [Camellia sinensis]
MSPNPWPPFPTALQAAGQNDVVLIFFFFSSFYFSASFFVCLLFVNPNPSLRETNKEGDTDG